MKYNASLLDLALNNVEALSKEISFLQMVHRICSRNNLLSLKQFKIAHQDNSYLHNFKEPSY